MGNPRLLGPYYLVGDCLGPCRYKREVERVDAIEVLSWAPGKAYVHYRDAGLFDDTAGPVKIYHRKDGSAYVQFEGKRYTVDETIVDKLQWVGELTRLMECKKRRNNNEKTT